MAVAEGTSWGREFAEDLLGEAVTELIFLGHAIRGHTIEKTYPLDACGLKSHTVLSCWTCGRVYVQNAPASQWGESAEFQRQESDRPQA